MTVPPFTSALARSPASADYRSEDSVRALAARIQATWHKLGHTQVRVRAEKITVSENRNLYHEWAVRSNLIGGLPPVAAKMARAA